MEPYLQLSDALEGGDEVTAARLAVRLALFWRRTGYPDETQGVMMVCGGLDGGARLALKAGHLLAAEGYLILAGPYAVMSDPIDRELPITCVAWVIPLWFDKIWSMARVGTGQLFGSVMKSSSGPVSRTPWLNRPSWPTRKVS